MSADGYQATKPARFRMHPNLISFAEEFRATSVRLLAYVCGVGALALIMADLYAGTVIDTVATAVPLRHRDSWTQAARPQPAFAAPVADFSGRSESYEILRHAEGGRKDILRWSAAIGEAPLSQLELYRPGTELVAFAPPTAEIAARATFGRTDSVQTAGVLETKFGSVALVRFTSEASGKPRPCIGFAHSFDAPRLQISGWTCQGETPQVQRQSIACVLDRLTMLSAGNDPRVAELFARAELRRTGCSHAAPASADWVSATNEPVLRGRM